VVHGFAYPGVFHWPLYLYAFTHMIDCPFLLGHGISPRESAMCIVAAMISCRLIGWRSSLIGSWSLFAIVLPLLACVHCLPIWQFSFCPHPVHLLQYGTFSFGLSAPCGWIGPQTVSLVRRLAVDLIPFCHFNGLLIPFHLASA
jgi:hypothetical protein